MLDVIIQCLAWWYPASWYSVVRIFPLLHGALIVSMSDAGGPSPVVEARCMLSWLSLGRMMLVGGHAETRMCRCRTNLSFSFMAWSRVACSCVCNYGSCSASYYCMQGTYNHPRHACMHAPSAAHLHGACLLALEHLGRSREPQTQLDIFLI
jgi:hypothetical protein